MGFKFSEEIESILGKSGWTPSRTIDTASIKRAVLDDGYSWFENAALFLASFGGLAVSSNTLATPAADVNFNVFNAIRSFSPLWVLEDYSARLGKRFFCPVGTAYSDHLLLFMSEDGCLYGGYDDYLALIDSNSTHAIERLLRRSQLDEIE